MISIMTSLLLATSVGATQFSAEEKNCAKGVYCADEMVCVTTIDGQPPRGMHPDYYTHVLAIKTFKSVKNLGGGKKTLVDSLQMNAEPTGEKKLTMNEAKERADFEYGNYGPPASVKGKSVRINWGSTSHGSQGLKLEIQSSTQKGDHRIDYLTGTEEIKGSVVGSYRLLHECEAKIVDAPTRIDDNTK